MGSLWMVLVIVAIIGLPQYISAYHVMCYYDSRSYNREGLGKMLPADIEPSLGYCTHLVYGYAKIDSSNYELEYLNNDLEPDATMDNYRAIVSLKKRYPGLRVLLSVGGGADEEDSKKYLELLQDSKRREEFASSAKSLVKQYGFDGLDVAWQFPEIEPKSTKHRTRISIMWHEGNETVVLVYPESHEDDKPEEHRKGFTKLLKKLNEKFMSDNLLLTTTVLPNVNKTEYYEAQEIKDYVDFINLMAFDLRNPKHDYDLADFPAPIYPYRGYEPMYTVDGQVRWWLERGVPGNKLILGIPTFARTWTLLLLDGVFTDLPPTYADGPGEEGPYTKTRGLMSYAEICSAINPAIKGTTHALRRVTDPSNKLGTYAFREKDPTNTREIIWAGYEDPETAGHKAAYVKTKSLAGVSLFDLSLDDFRGICSGDKFPIARAVKERLQ